MVSRKSRVKPPLTLKGAVFDLHKCQAACTAYGKMSSAGIFPGQKSQRIKRWLLCLAPLALLEEVKLSTMVPLLHHCLFTVPYLKNDIEKTVQTELFQSQIHLIHTGMKPFRVRQCYVVPCGCKWTWRAGTMQMCPGTGAAAPPAVEQHCCMCSYDKVWKEPKSMQ